MEEQLQIDLNKIIKILENIDHNIVNNLPSENFLEDKFTRIENEIANLKTEVRNK